MQTVITEIATSTAQPAGATQVLDHSRELVDMLFGRAPVGVAILDRELVLQQCNPTWANFVGRYTTSPADHVVPGESFFRLAPGIEGEALPLFAEVFSGHVVQRDALRLQSDGIISYWDVVLTPLEESGEVTAVVIMTTDATERVLAYQTLEQRVEERTRDATRREHVSAALSDLMTVLNSNSSLDETLEYIVTQACRLLGSSSGAIFHLDPADQILRVEAAHGLPAEYVSGMTVPLGLGALGRAISTNQPVAVPDLNEFLSAGAMGLDDERRAGLERLAGRYCALLALPLTVKEQLYGGFVLYYPEHRAFSAEDVELAATLVSHISLAIGNSNLRVQAEQAAVAAERSRLARDLHDSVTQTLFSASLIAEVLPRLWEKDQAEGRNRLEELRQLTRGALAEMRMLLLELRPASLTEVGLGELLRQLTEATTGRTASSLLTIDLKVEPEQRQRHLPPDVQISLYRIAQEALNNVARHSKATHATAHLRIGGRKVELSISDDGRGFDPASIPPEHLGLSIMRERAASIGARLDISSRVSKGTRVRVIWPDNQNVSRRRE